MGAKGLEPLERPLPLYQTVQEAIRGYIVSNRLESGAALPPEGELARRLGVSRNSVREAVKALESVGVLESRRGSGIFVADFSFDPLFDNLHYGMLVDLEDLVEILEIRRVLEVGMISEVVDRITPEEVSDIAAIVDAMEASGDTPEKVLELDRKFHAALFTCVGNAALLKLIDTFWRAFSTARDLARTPKQGHDHIVKMHRDIIWAVGNGDHKGAVAALERHYADSMLLKAVSHP